MKPVKKKLKIGMLIYPITPSICKMHRWNGKCIITNIRKIEKKLYVFAVNVIDSTSDIYSEDEMFFTEKEAQKFIYENGK